MTLAELTASNSARLAEIAKPSWFIDDPEYQQAAANFMHEAAPIVERKKNMSRSINGALRGMAARGTDDIDAPPIPEYLYQCYEIMHYLGEPLYSEWVDAGPDDNTAFSRYVADEYKKMLGQREDAERDADWQRQTSELRHG